MSPSVTPPETQSVTTPTQDVQPIEWADPARAAAFQSWMSTLRVEHGLQAASLRLAAADASFRRYFRVDGTDGRRIIMDAPPDREDCDAFERVARLMAEAGLNVPQLLAWDQTHGFMLLSDRGARLMAEAGLNVPQLLAWDQTHGFMLLSDLGTQTMMQALLPERPQANLGLYLQAVDVLIAWQRASRPGVLPAYDEVLLLRELELFPQWYLAQHRAVVVDAEQRRTLDLAFQTIVRENLAWPSVYVHRDFMPRNLMLPAPSAVAGRATPLDAGGHGRLGVLDFQDAVYGPITYDIASLMRDAFLSWEEDFVLDVTIRYWEKARAAGLAVGRDFGAFYRGVEWMGLQRHLKVAGVFARLTLRDGKPQYLADAPRFIRYIRATTGRYRELRPLLRLLDKAEGVQDAAGYVFGRV